MFPVRSISHQAIHPAVNGKAQTCRAAGFPAGRFCPQRIQWGHPTGMNEPLSQNIIRTRSKVTAEERAQRSGQAGCVVWLTGLSAAGKSTIGAELERELFNQGRLVYMLDGDNLRHGLCSDLGF